MKELLKIYIDDTFSGLMIKEILFDHYHFSRKSLSKIKRSNGIFLNGFQTYTTVRVKKGDLIQVYVKEETSDDIVPQPIPVDIVYEDEDIVVINKQSNIVVHPTRSHYLGTIANGLMDYWQTQGKCYRFRPVNRLDKDTSGLFIVAKNQFSHHKLALQIQSNQLKRTYHAIVHGKISNSEGIIEAPILKDPNHPVKRLIARNEPEAKSAITHYKVLYPFKDFTLVELRLLTGRTHQIRVHMSHIHHPLVGDELYGGEFVGNITRQALHAIHLDFFHPINNQHLIFNAPYPIDIQSFLMNE